MNETQTKNTIDKWWAERAGTTVDKLQEPGTLIRFEPELDENGTVILYEMYDMSFIRIGPTAAGRLGLASEHYDKIVTAEQFALNCRGGGHELRVKPVLLDNYLYREDYNAWAPPAGYEARRINPEQKDDLSALKKLYSSSSENDLDEADIYVDEHDPVIFGLFSNGDLAAYSSYRLWGEAIADMGVLIHPAHRQKSLGKAATSVLCTYCFEHDIVPMARIFDYHEYSLRIPRALGFKAVVKVHSFALSL